MNTFSLGIDKLTVKTLANFSTQKTKLTISKEVISRIQNSREIVDNLLKDSKSFYGINTGFGYLSNVKISAENLEELQINLIRSHSCGVGEIVDESIVKSLIFLRAHNFSLGHSGVSLELVEFMLTSLERGLSPVLHEQGSVGASGDLAPLAHLALGFLGEGDCLYNGKRYKTKEVLKHLELTPYQPKPKEGLSLINGTSFMATLAAFAINEAKNLQKSANLILAMSLSAFRGSITPFDKKIHDVRQQEGQREVAAKLRKIFEQEDPILESHKDCSKVQDPYSFRCAAQVHGASLDVLNFCETTVNRELNSETDNPLVFSDNTILSGGNFHGQALAFSMDFLAIAVSELGSISERRIEKLIDPNMSDLPAFLTKGSGLNSGFMIPHVTAAALASENKVLCHPASVDSIPTSCDKEDHVSMGPIACHKARQVNSNVANILAIELLAACQGLDLLKPLSPNKTLNKIYEKVRELSPESSKDRSLSEDIQKVSDMIKNGDLLKAIDH